MGRAFHRLAAVAVAVSSIAVAAGCGGDGSTLAGADHANVTERDFHISAPKRLPAGDVVFRVRNEGPDDHELLVLKQAEPGGAAQEEEEEAETPLRSDGVTVDEDKLGPALVGTLEAQEPGVHELHVKLGPGRYELICNMAGHYLGGMETEVEVQ